MTTTRTTTRFVRYLAGLLADRSARMRRLRDDLTHLSAPEGWHVVDADTMRIVRSSPSHRGASIIRTRMQRRAAGRFVVLSGAEYLAAARAPRRTLARRRGGVWGDHDGRGPGTRRLDRARCRRGVEGDLIPDPCRPCDLSCIARLERCLPWALMEALPDAA